jgi:hypothetical protein
MARCTPVLLYSITICLISLLLYPPPPPPDIQIIACHVISLDRLNIQKIPQVGKMAARTRAREVEARTRVRQAV